MEPKPDQQVLIAKPWNSFVITKDLNLDFATHILYKTSKAFCHHKKADLNRDLSTHILDRLSSEKHRQQRGIEGQ
jgi:hypothetical protein